MIGWINKKPSIIEGFLAGQIRNLQTMQLYEYWGMQVHGTTFGAPGQLTFSTLIVS
jgi:hypothetical protein